MNRTTWMLATLALLLGGVGKARADLVTIPDPAPSEYLYFGSGDASVTYSGVTFSTSSALSDGAFFNVGSLFSGVPAVLSSQGESFGVANILITLPVATNSFSINYGTFDGSDVTFALSSGPSYTQGSTAGSFYTTPDFFSVTSSTPFTSVLVTSSDFVLDINNISFSVPEPSGIALLGMGVVCLAAGYAARRRKLALAA